MKRKVISIILISFFSIILWVFTSLSGEYSPYVRFPIRIINNDEDNAVSNTSADEVVLKLKGQGWQLAQLTFGRNPEFIINSTDKRGRKTVQLRNFLELNNWLTSSIQVIEILPESIDYAIERKVSKKVKIEPNINLDFKPGYGIVGEINVLSDTLEVTGPKSVIDKIDVVYTKQNDFSGLDRKFSENIELEPINDAEFSFTETIVQLDVQKIVDKTFENIAVETRRVPSTRRLQLFPDRINVVLRGGINVLGMLESSDLKAYVFYRDALRDTMGSIEPHIEIPPQTIFIDNKPRRLEYIIKQY
ncbi:YbbR-like domain-containing protein [Bacteroidota bacterium]